MLQRGSGSSALLLLHRLGLNFECEFSLSDENLNNSADVVGDREVDEDKMDGNRPEVDEQSKTQVTYK